MLASCHWHELALVDVAADGQTGWRWVGQTEEPLIRPFSCRVFMDGRLLMNFLSRFFTPLLSALSDALCLSLELLNTSAREQQH